MTPMTTAAAMAIAENTCRRVQRVHRHPAGADRSFRQWRRPPTALEIANRVKIVKLDSAVLEFAGDASFSFTARDTGAVGRLCRSRMIA